MRSIDVIPCPLNWTPFMVDESLKVQIDVTLQYTRLLLIYIPVLTAPRLIIGCTNI